MCLPPTRLPLNEQMFLITDTQCKIRDLIIEIKALKKELKELHEENAMLIRKNISLK